MQLKHLSEALAWDHAKSLYKGPVAVVAPSVVCVDELDQDAIVRKLERCIRVAYKSEDKITPDSWSKMITHILSLKHESTLEHESLTFHVTTNRGVTHEMVRHRIGCSYTQESTRYCNYGSAKKGGTVVYPTWLMGKSEDHKKFWYDGMVQAFDRYNTSLEMGWKAQEARGQLPHDTKAEIIVTMNLRAIRHFLGLRLPPSAHPDIRVIAGGVLDISSNIPLIFDEFLQGSFTVA